VDIAEQFKIYYGKELGRNVKLPSEIAVRYAINACLASSESKEVYLMTAYATREQVIVRRLPLDKSETNRTEYDLLSSVEHPKIPKAIELLEAGGYSYLIRAYIPGTSLNQWLAARGSASEREAIGIVVQICDILTYLHTRRPPVIHRDIKPQNVIIGPDGAVYLIDFDISRKYDSNASKDTMYLGTSATAPPEQYGYGQTDARSDIYSLGILLIFLYTGRYERTALGEIPPHLRKIAETCTQFAPKERYTSANRLKKALLFHKCSLPLKVATGVAIVCAILGAFCIGRAWAAHSASLAASASAETSLLSDEDFSGVTSVAEDGAVTFASGTIEEAVREKLGKEPGDAIRLSELQSLTELSVVGVPSEDCSLPIQFVNDQVYYYDRLITRGDISMLTDLTLMKSLTDLTLAYQRIDNLEPLQNLHLKSLILVGNYISDLSPLSNIQTLQTLMINNNPVSDLSPLTSLKRLTMIGFQFSSVTDISPLNEIPTLTQIDMRGAPCTDYSALTAMASLSFADISESSAQDAAVVSGNAGIRELLADDCGITSIEDLQSMPDLERLELNGNDLTTLSGIERYQNLESLSLRENELCDLSALTALPALKELDLRGTDVDLSPLLHIPSLQEIICSPDMQARIDAIQNEAAFEIAVLDLP